MKKYIPDIITCLNLVCGTASVILTLWGFYWPAFCFMIAGAVFDVCDGAAARLLGAYSNVGKELDSLSDLVTFGLAPALMFFSWYYKINSGYPSWAAFIALVIVPFAALRLAKFNVDDRQKHSFLGLPTPAMAMIAGSATAYSHICMACGTDTLLSRLLCSGWFIPVVSVLLALLLVSEIPMFSLKPSDGARVPLLKKTFPFAALLIVVICMIIRPDGIPFAASLILAVCLVFTWYVLSQLIGCLFPRKAS